MLGKIFGILCIVSIVSALLTGNLPALGNAILDGAGAAVTLTLTLCGMMCLWNGLLNVFREAGAIRRLSVLLSPFLKRFFPDAYRTGHGTEEITACVSANLLGIGNAATPLALAAMKQLKKDAYPEDTASPDMITLCLLNSAPLTLLPASLIALRRAAGSADPFRIVLPVWIASAASALFALLLSRILAIPIRRKRKKMQGLPKNSENPGTSGALPPSKETETACRVSERRDPP